MLRISGLALVIVVLATYTLACGGAATAGLLVSVKDADGRPILYARVESEAEPAGQAKLGEFTGVEGTVSFEKIKPGDYTFRVTRTDFGDKELVCHVKASGTKADVTLVKVRVIAATPGPHIGMFAKIAEDPVILNGQVITVVGFLFSGFAKFRLLPNDWIQWIFPLETWSQPA